jgi:hypothetical protein
MKLFNNSKSLKQYCSWCFQKTTHTLYEKNYLRRNVYKCSNCNNYTLECRVCKNMAKGSPADEVAKEYDKNLIKKFFQKTAENWDNEFCAEHDGTIANFDVLNNRFNDLEEYEILFKNKKFNFVKLTAMTGGMIGGAVLFIPLGIVAAYQNRAIPLW